MLLVTFTVLALATLVSAQNDSDTSAGLSIPLKKKIVHECIDSHYVGAIHVGDQCFEVVFDTTSYDLVLIGKGCKYGACEECDANLTRYNGQHDSQWGYARVLDTGYAYGYKAKSNVSIYDDRDKSTSLTVRNQVFLLAYYVSKELCEYNADGVFGLGPLNSNKTVFKAPSFFDNAVKQGYINPVFSIHHSKSNNGEHNGQVIFGGTDPKYYTGKFTYAPIAVPSTWQFKLDYIKIQKKNYLPNGKPTYAFVDTSKSLIVGPYKIISEINKKLGCKDKPNGNKTICEFDNCQCSAHLPDVVFGIGGGKFNISAEHYVVKNDSTCYSAFVPSRETQVIHLGDIFVDHYYSYFDSKKKRMGFAKAAQNK